MSVLRRYHGSGDTVFITCVSYERRPLLVKHCDLFWKAVGAVKDKVDFDLIAYAILPDHVHLVLDAHGGDFTNVMQRLKMSYGMYYRQCVALPDGRVWQHRYWDHVIRDQTDMNRHIDYIHYNPVKHGLVRNPAEWEHSSYRGFYDRGMYEEGWGESEVPRLEGEFGE